MKKKYYALVLILFSVVLAYYGISKKLINKETIKNPSPEKVVSLHSLRGIINFHHWRTLHNVAVYFAPVSTLPMIDIQVIFDAGSIRDQTQGGLAYLTNTLLASGTQLMSADQIAQRFDKVGAQYQAYCQREMAGVKLRTLSQPEVLEDALQTLAQIINQAAFPLPAFKREQQYALTTLQQQSQLPQILANRTFYATLYPQHPYGQEVLGEENTLQALTLEAVRAFYQKYYVASNATIIIVGDASLKQANQIAQRLIEQLPKGERAPLLSPVKDLPEKQIKKIPFPSSQTHILLGAPFIQQNDPDYYALYVGNHILGGSAFTSRLFDTIRNQQGLAYSVYSRFIPMQQRGPYILGCQTRNEQAQQALNLMEATRARFIEQGPTEQELVQAKKNLIGGYALQFASNAAISQQLAMLAFYQLPLDYFNQFKPALERLTTQDIKEAFQRKMRAPFAVVMLGAQND